MADAGLTFDDIDGLTTTPVRTEAWNMLGGEAVAIGPKPFKEQVTRELKVWQKTIQDANIRIE